MSEIQKSASQSPSNTSLLITSGVSGVLGWFFHTEVKANKKLSKSYGNDLESHNGQDFTTNAPIQNSNRNVIFHQRFDSQARALKFVKVFGVLRFVTLAVSLSAALYAVYNYFSKSNAVLPKN